MKKANVKKIVTTVIVIGIVGLVGTPIITSKQGLERDYKLAEVSVRDLETNYSFTGNISSKKTQNVISTNVAKIEEIEVSEGDKVEKDDVLFITTDGTKIKSSINGTVNKIFVDEDEQVMSGTILCEVVDFENLELIIKIDEYDIDSIVTDKEMDVFVNAIDTEVSGKVSKVSNTAIIQNGVAYFEGVVSLEKIEDIKVGMSAEASIIKEKKEGALVLEAEAITFNDENEATVLIENSSGEKVEKVVKVGMSDGVYIEILEGLSLNDVVYYQEITSNNMPVKLPMM